MTEVGRLAADLNASAERLHGVGNELGLLRDAPLELFANAPGRLGEVGQRLSNQLDRAWLDRVDEVNEAHSHLMDLAEAVERALVRYAQTEDHAHHGLNRARAEDM